jgi:hypothetical protein
MVQVFFDRVRLHRIRHVRSGLSAAVRMLSDAYCVPRESKCLLSRERLSGCHKKHLMTDDSTFQSFTHEACD